METIFLYLLKSSALIAVFFLAYYFLLRKETFFKSNRWFLLLGLVTSIILPLVTFKKIVWIEPTPMVGHTVWTQVPVSALQTPKPESLEIDWLLVIAGIYAIGIIIFLFKFVFDFSGLIKALKGKTVTQQADFKFIDVNEKVSPFSYFNYIVYNSSMFTEAELEYILEHEKVHCEQRHSVDVIIARIFCILFWYNPFIWLYQKAMLQNLEFIADSEALKNIADKKAYQITLLKVTTHDNCVAITNHFYQSLIKKRIIMLNKNQSKKSNAWKYFLIGPVLAAFLFYFQVKVIAQEKDAPVVTASGAMATPPNIVINKNTTDAELKEHSKMMKDKYNAKLKFSKVKRNSSGEITSIKADYSDKDGHKATYVIAGDEAIKPISINRKDNGSIAFGNTGKQLRIFSRGGSGEAAEAEDAVPPVDAEDAEDASYAYAFDFHDVPDVPEMPELEELGDLSNLGDVNVVVKTIGKDGKMKIIVNGEEMNIDTDKILADVDIEKIQDQARKSVIIAKKQIDAARPQIERAKRRSAEARRNSDDARRESEQAREEMEQAREEMEQSRRELEEARKQLEKSRQEFERQREKAQIKKAAKKK
jgi:hypothetical protein